MDTPTAPPLLALKRKLTEAPIIQYPNAQGTYKIKTNSSDSAIAGVLCIKTATGDFLPVAYKSRKLNNGKRHYLIHNKELITIVHCLSRWRCYLEGLDTFTI